MSTKELRLVERAKVDSGAFELLYEAHVDRIYNYIFHRVGTVEDAEDLTARTFHRALSSLPGYVHTGAPFSAWLYRIAHNLVANWHRDRSRRRESPLDGAPLGAETALAGDGHAVKVFAAEQVRAAVRRLEPDRQTLVVLKFSEGMTNAEIGAVLGRSEGAIKSLYHRTLLALRDRLEEMHMGYEEPEEIIECPTPLRLS